MLVCAVVFSACAMCSSGITLKGKKEHAETTIVRRAATKYQSPNWQVRRQAIEDVNSAMIRTPAAETFLLRATYDPHILIRVDAVKALSGYKTNRTFERIKDVAASDEFQVRWSALVVLSSFEKPAAAPVFVMGLDSSEWMIREASITGLLKIPDQAVQYISVPYILDCLDDPNVEVRIATLNNVQVQNNALYKKISSMLDDDTYGKPTILKAVIKALKGYPLDPDTRKYLVSCLTHSNADVRIQALRTLKADKKKSS